MWLVRHFENALTVVMSWICILSVVISLVLPYSSHYFAKDSKVSCRFSNELQHEKVEVSTSLLASPAECLNTKLIQDFRSVERSLTSLDYAHLLTFYPADNSSEEGYRNARYRQIFPWRPSIVIALKKLII
jgi:hypothetical protein